jgi:hypothetical protein
MIIARYVTIGFIFTPMNAVSLMVLPPDQVRMGSGLTNLMQQDLGGTLGLAMMTTVTAERERSFPNPCVGPETLSASNGLVCYADHRYCAAK